MRIMIRNFTFLLSMLVLLPYSVAGAYAQTFVIQEAQIHPVSGPVIESGTIVVENGIITQIGPDGSVPLPLGARVIYATGKIVTPGFIDVSTGIGLVEVSNVQSTRDGSGAGPPIRASFSVLDGINPATIVIPSVRLGGVTTVATIPSGGIISGTGAVIDLFGSNIDDMLLVDKSALYGSYNESAAASAGGSRGAAAGILRSAFDDAAFLNANRAQYESGATRALSIDHRDAETLQSVLDNSIPFVVSSARASDIDFVLRLTDEYGLETVISGGEEAWMRADLLADRQIPVIVKPLANSPTQFDRLGTRFDNAALLSNARVDVIISSFESHKAGTLRREAGHAVRYGMNWDKALHAITIGPARMLGIDASHGSLEVGKTANLVVWSGDPFQFSTEAERVFIRGHEMPHDSRQKRLFERYRTLDATAPQFKANH
jgi:imidazolonepropionase-like amidohydrolase